jgi:CheY-like chemotaxis protein
MIDPAKSRTQVIIAVLLIVLAVLRLAFHDTLSGRMDNVFLILVGSGVVLLVVPLNYLRSFKAAGFELALDQPQVQGAISSLSVDGNAHEKIESQLSQMQDQLNSIRGSRVLWIDDEPHTLVGERRLLRALGVGVITATSSPTAEKILESDNDFDLIVSDICRDGDSYKTTKGVPMNEGVNFFVRLRESYPDPVISKLPVIFYSARDLESLKEATRPALSYRPLPFITNSREDLIPTAIKVLAKSRETPIQGTSQGNMSQVQDAGPKEQAEPSS